MESTNTPAIKAAADRPSDAIVESMKAILFSGRAKLRVIKDKAVNMMIAANMNYGTCGVVSYHLNKLIDRLSAPPAVTAKPDLAAAHQQAAIGAAVAMATKWDSMPDAKPGIVLAAPVEQASADDAALMDLFLTALGSLALHDMAEAEAIGAKVRAIIAAPDSKIPPQQAPDPIYLIRPKAGGPTWTECISKQSHDAAMQLGVYESLVVVELGGQEKAS